MINHHGGVMSVTVHLADLWLPILVSAITVFLVSSVVHMLLTYHKNDFQALPDEENFNDAVGSQNLEPGQYSTPFCNSMKEMGEEAFQNKLAKGPVMTMTVYPNGPYPIGKNLLNWFIFSLVVSLFAAYIASNALTTAANYLQVMQITATAAFLAYGIGFMQESVWYGRNWLMTAKFVFDGLLYALCTGGVFGWLWPEMMS